MSTCCSNSSPDADGSEEDGSYIENEHKAAVKSCILQISKRPGYYLSSCNSELSCTSLPCVGYLSVSVSYHVVGTHHVSAVGHVQAAHLPAAYHVQATYHVAVT